MSLERPSSHGSVLLRALLWLVSIVLLLGTAALVFLDRMLRNQYEPALGELRRDVIDNIDFFCEQQALLARDPWFHEPRTEGDAGVLLNAWLPWDSKYELPAGSPLAVPKGFPQPTKDIKDWLTATVDVSALDFGWMRRLHGYDRWETTRNTPMPIPERVSWMDTPVPSFAWVRVWAKLRLLQGLRTGQQMEAARDVRQLAWLLYRTDVLLGAVWAIHLLELEREAYDSMKSPPPEWHPMSREQLARLRGIILSSSAFSSLSAPAEVAKRARHCGAPAVSGCIGLSEGSIFLRYLKPLAEDTYREAYAAHAEDLATMSCATSTPRFLWERGKSIDEERYVLMEDPRWLDFVPASYARKYRAGILLSVDGPGTAPLKKFRASLESGSFQPENP